MLSHRISVPVFLAMISTGTAAWAHPGHGSTAPETVQHYLLEPSHGWWLLVLAITIFSSLLYKRIKKQQTKSKVRVRK